MAYLAFLAIFLVPTVEIALFIVIGGTIGLWPTLALAIGTAVLGSYLIRRQGLNILARAQSELATNRLPVAELFDGLCLFVAGALLLTPGFATDAMGGLLLVPPVRRWLRRTLERARVAHTAARTGSRNDAGARIIDADYEDLTERL